MRIESVDILAAGFQLLSHAFTGHDELQKLIVLDEHDGISLVNFVKKRLDKIQEIPATERRGETIVNVISQGFNEKTVPILVTTKKADDNTKFNNYLGDFTDCKLKFLFESDSTPMLITNPVTIRPLLLYTEKGIIKYGEFQGEFVQLGELMLDNNTRPPTGIHTSSYVDVTGDMNPELILHVKNDQEHKIVILKLKPVTTEEKWKLEAQKIQEINLTRGMEIGPIMFTEISSPLKSDMIFISKEGNQYNLNLYKNENPIENPKKEFSMPSQLREFFVKAEASNIIFDSPTSYPLDQLLQKKDFEIKLTDENGTPTGMFLADLFGTGIKDVYIPVNEVGAGITAPGHSSIHLLRFEGENEFIDKGNLTENNIQLGLITGMSVLDTEDTGIEQLMVNVKSANGTSHNSEIKLINFDRERKVAGITVLPMKIMDGMSSFISGACFAIMYEGLSKARKVSFSPQSSYLSFQRPKVYIGLQETCLFINHFVIKLPSETTDYSYYDIDTFLVPNTLVVFSVNKKEFKLQSFFSRRYYKMTFISLIVILIFFICVYFFLSIQEKKKYKTVMNRDSMRRVFNAL